MQSNERIPYSFESSTVDVGALLKGNLNDLMMKVKNIWFKAEEGMPPLEARSHAASTISPTKTGSIYESPK